MSRVRRVHLRGNGRSKAEEWETEEWKVGAWYAEAWEAEEWEAEAWRSKPEKVSRATWCVSGKSGGWLGPKYI